MKNLYRKILFTSIIFLGFASEGLFALESKANLTFGLTPVQYDSEESEAPFGFGGGYALLNGAVSNDFFTAAGKIYWRFSEAASFENLSQKLDVKRAYVRYRPFGTESLEFSLGKLYSYYLTGNYFQLSEIYTGSSRWGKTGAGAKLLWNGFTFGAAIPFTESYKKFSEEFGVNASVEYDFSFLENGMPLNLCASVLYTNKEFSNSDFSFTASANYSKKLGGMVKNIFATFSCSFNSEPYVASSVFKNVWNYNRESLKKVHLASFNFRSKVGEVSIVAESEAGLSMDGTVVPLYAAAQVQFPLGESSFFLRPRFYYYAAFDLNDSLQSAQSFEFYPSVRYEKKDLTLSLGGDFVLRQNVLGEYKWKWSVPIFAEFRVGR